MGTTCLLPDRPLISRPPAAAAGGHRLDRCSPSLAPAYRPVSRLVVSVSASGGEPAAPRSVEPVYLPTPRDRELRTPHSGYHFSGSTQVFFEGWFLKVSIPKCKQSFCFIYSVENPAFRDGMGMLDMAVYGPRFTGVGAQILGADDKYICQYTKKSRNFWGSRHDVMLGNTFIARKDSIPPNGEVPPQEFSSRVLEGFQVSPLWHQGSITDDGRSKHVQTVKTARWEYRTHPVYGWGDVKSKQKSTGGWPAAIPVFEPHWQICMASGLSTGWIEWGGELFEFENAPSYLEKNWGGGFPRKWFWVQCNVFDGAPGEVSLTAGGALWKLPGLVEYFESPALIGIHFEGTFYEFVPWNGTVSWEISPWGYWSISAENDAYLVELEVTTKQAGTSLRVPTVESGYAVACKDTGSGELKLQMWKRKYDGCKGELILDATSSMASVEVGGGPWFSAWKDKTAIPEVLNQALRVPLDMESLFPISMFKPPGL
ncbi:putative tocopherol cyclase, chloroplastic [Iris pallida]|uniref:Tocopherol cyclase, chloroplastic n=1 Tax=Iris pallida TaxID=29817 RepID=A0AAX6FKT2_IRIPA|nr:putative tocopherol cyclase, chloroplastic [Iris pallida]